MHAYTMIHTYTHVYTYTHEYLHTHTANTHTGTSNSSAMMWTSRPSTASLLSRPVSASYSRPQTQQQRLKSALSPARPSSADRHTHARHARKHTCEPYWPCQHTSTFRSPIVQTQILGFSLTCSALIRCRMSNRTNAHAHTAPNSNVVRCVCVCVYRSWYFSQKWLSPRGSDQDRASRKLQSRSALTQNDGSSLPGTRDGDVDTGSSARRAPGGLRGEDVDLVDDAPGESASDLTYAPRLHL